MVEFIPKLSEKYRKDFSDILEGLGYSSFILSNFILQQKLITIIQHYGVALKKSPDSSPCLKSSSPNIAIMAALSEEYSFGGR